MIAVGVGASRGCPPGELAALVDAGLAAASVPPRAVRALASVDVKADEPAILALARERGWPLRTFAAEALACVAVPTPSAAVARHVGTPSVAEASALLAAAPAQLLVAKRRSAHATCAIAATVPALAPTPPAASRDDSTGISPVQSAFDDPAEEEEEAEAEGEGDPRRAEVSRP